MWTVSNIIKGNLLESDCDVWIHQANCFGTMGAGIAKQLVAKYPGVLEADLQFTVPIGSKQRLGYYSQYVTPDGVTIINMYAQYRYGRGGTHTDLKAMEMAFRSILRNTKGRKIGLPYKIGCGLAGGDWNEVQPLLESLARKSGRQLYFYQL